jgi:hypothetical protein
VLDEEFAKAALQAALHLAVTGRMVLQGGAEVRAARMPATQRTLDVCGA